MATTTNNLPATLSKPKIVARLREHFKNNTAAVISSAISIWKDNALLQKCSDNSILSALAQAGAFNLPITPSLGQAFIVPYKKYDKETKTETYEAQFQLGWKGYMQLALRTGQYVKIHAGKVCEGEFRGFNPITGEPQIGQKISNEVVGYVAYMKLKNGFEKTIFMSIDDMREHAEKYSQSYSYDKRNGKKSSPWTTSFDAMACKTVLKSLLKNFGILSTELATAIQADQAVIDDNNGTFTHVDNGDRVQNRDNIYVVAEPEDTVETIDVQPSEETAEVEVNSEPAY